MPTNQPGNYNSLYGFCQGVIAGKCDIKPSVQKLIDDGKFPNAATWAKQLLSEFDLAANTAANSKDSKHPATPQYCIAGTAKKLHWKCSSGHTWTAAGYARVSGNSCPICSGKQVLAGFNDMATTHPHLTAEWDYTANADANAKDPKHPATPQYCIAGTAKKLHWKCSSGHTWAATGSKRVNGSGCLACAGKQVLAGFNDMATTHPHLTAEWDYKANADAKAKDPKHPATPQYCIAGTNKKLHWKCSSGHTWAATGNSRVSGSGCPVCAGKQVLAGLNDMATTHPHLAAEWDYKANAAAKAKDPKHPAKPQDCVAGTGKKIHWKCSSGHTWTAAGGDRTQGNGCPVCAGNQVSVGSNDMATTHPDLTAEWDYAANAAANATDPKHPAKPQDCVAGTSKKIHWKCSSGHTWTAAGYARVSGNSCPVCSRRQLSVGINDMTTTRPDLAAEWDYTANAAANATDPKHPAKPQDCVAGTAKKLHWKCSSGHTWAATGSARVSGTGCPACTQGIGVSGTVSLVRRMINNGTWQHAAQSERYWILQAAGATANGRDNIIKKIAATTLPKDATEEEIAEAVDAILEQDGLTNTGAPEAEADDNVVPSDDFDLDTEIEDEVVSEGNLPEVQAGEALEALDSIPGISADSETGKALIVSYVHKCWKDAYRNGPTSAREHVESADISGALTTVIREHFLEELDAAEQLTIPNDFSCEGLGFEPNLMQRHVAADIRKRRRVGNWSGTGTGKTVSAVLSSRVIGAKHTIILCPNSTVDGWKETIEAAVPTAKVFTELDTYQGDIPGPVYWVLNNEKLQQRNSEPKAKKIVETHRIDLVVVDEVHNFKVASTNLETMSRRRTTLEGICAEASEHNPDLAVLGMSATPVINNLVEAKSLIELVTGNSHDDLDTRSTVNNCLAANKQLVLLGSRQMPNYPITVRDNFNIEVELSDDNVEEIKALGKRPHSAYIEQVLTRFRAPAIADYLAERLEDEGEAFRPTIVYTEYKDKIIEVLRKEIEEKGISVAEHHGDNHGGKDRFINRDAQVLICTSAIATGVDGLQKVCDRMIINALPWTDALYTQLKGRIVRQGSNFKHVDLIRVVTSWDSGSGEDDGVWSWDAGRYRRVEWKKGLADAAVDGVIPEAEHISPTATRDHLIQWLDRLTSEGEITIERPVIKVPLSDEELEKAIGRRQLGEFSELNRIWNTSNSSTTHNKLAADPIEWSMYHTLYREARATWEVVPAGWVAEQLSNTARPQRVADLGCGERLLEDYLGADTIHEVVCFDHIAIDDTVIACDVTDIGEDLAPSKSFDRVVLCLAIMAKNQSDYFTEAARLLDNGGTLYMVETNSHIGENQDKFNQMAYDAGFGTPTIEKLGDKFWTLTAHKR